MIRTRSQLFGLGRSWRSGAEARSMSQARESPAPAGKALTMHNLNPNVIRLEYAVRGPLVARAAQIEQELKKGASKPFKQVIRANLGDAHAMGQKPITFLRQVISCVSDPSLLDTSDYPDDVKQRARLLLDGCAGASVGAYTASYGLEVVRRHVAEYIAARDGHPCDWNNVVLSTGATAAIKNCLQLFVGGQRPAGVMVPIPQYPLYSATLAEYGLEKVDYYLAEERGWALDVAELERALADARERCDVRAIAVINPGNPTGQVLTRANVDAVLEFAARHRLLVLADEVYQHNVYAPGSAFHSFKKALMESPYKDNLELVSFMTVSKGYSGECGLRGGWMEVVNMDPEVQANLYKMISATLCPPSLGQAAVDAVARPPAPGDASHARWAAERDAVLGSLRQRAKLVADTFNSMPGFSCNEVQGAMYAFPRIELPPKAVEAAAAAGQQPDVFYAFRLLEHTGICVVAGSGFGQRPGTWHFRTTILPQPAALRDMLHAFTAFHDQFTKDFS